MRKIDRRRAATWRVIAMLEHEMTAAIFSATTLNPCCDGANWGSGGIGGEEPSVHPAHVIFRAGVMVDGGRGQGCTATALKAA